MIYLDTLHTHQYINAMDPKIKFVLNSIGKACAVLLVINLVSFAIDLALADEVVGWGFKHGAFSVNGEANGITISSLSGRVFLAVMFLAFVLNDRKRVKRIAS